MKGILMGYLKGVDDFPISTPKLHRIFFSQHPIPPAAALPQHSTGEFRQSLWNTDHTGPRFARAGWWMRGNPMKLDVGVPGEISFEEISIGNMNYIDMSVEKHVLIELGAPSRNCSVGI